MLNPDEAKWRNKGNSIACKICKGIMCCQYNACPASPEDFDNDTDKMKTALLGGNYSIALLHTARVFKLDGNFPALDLVEIQNNPEEAFYIRARNAGMPIVDIVHIEGTVHGPCVFWSYENGCALSYENRPKFGRTLIPGFLNTCHDYYDEYTPQGLKGQIIEEWKPFQKFLIQMISELSSKETSPLIQFV